MGEFERRIEQHMARGNELMAEVREEMRLNRIAYGHQLDVTRTVIERALERNNEVIERNRSTMSDVVARHERVTDGLIEAIADMREEIRAQTRAIFALIDRLEGGASTT